MKKILKNKRVIIILIILLFVIVMSIIWTLSFRNSKNNDVNKKLKSDEFLAYVKINPLVKLSFKSSYYECESKKGKVNICGKYSSKITKVELLNDDASIYENSSLDGKTLDDAISYLILTAKNNGYDISKINVTTNWSYDLDNINKNIKNKLKKENDINTNIKFDYQKILDEKKLLEKENIKTYTITFDTDGGLKLEDQTVAENQTVNKPTNPTKKGYNFIEWLLDGKSYDFNSKVIKNITLRAKWEGSDKTTSTTLNSVKQDNASNVTSNNKSNLSKREQDNITLRNQLKEKGLVWDTSDINEAYDILTKWSGGYNGEIIKNSYGESDIAYTIKMTLNTSACRGTDVLNIDWRNKEPIDFIYYLHSLGYNCSGNQGYYNNKHFTVNENNVIVFD